MTDTSSGEIRLDRIASNASMTPSAKRQELARRCSGRSAASVRGATQTATEPVKRAVSPPAPIQRTISSDAPYSSFATRQKWLIVALVAVAGMASPMTGNAFLPAVPVRFLLLLV